MIFWLFLITGLVLCWCLAPTLGEAYLWYCISVTPISIGLTLLLSLLLGKSSQYKMNSFSNYRIKLNEDKQSFHVWETDEDLSLNDVDDIVYVNDPPYSCISVFRYGLTGWRAKWLWPVYDSYRTITLYLPSEDET